MVCTKKTARKQHLGLPKARFPVTQRGTNIITNSSNSPVKMQTTLTPTFMGTESLKVGRAVDRINEEHANSPSQTIDEVCALVQDLRAHPPTFPVKDPENFEPPAAIVLSTPTLHMETVTETVCQPLLLARRAMATPA